MDLLKLSLALSIIGIFLLLVIVNILEPRQMKISKIDKGLIGKVITVEGQATYIKSIREKDFQIITLQDSTGEISITLDKISPLKKGEKIEVTGKVSEYEGQVQIQADKILKV